MALTKNEWVELRKIFNEDINFGDGNGPRWAVTFGSQRLEDYQISFFFSKLDDYYRIDLYRGRSVLTVIDSGDLSAASINIIKAQVDTAAAEIWDELSEKYERLKKIGESIERFRSKL